MLIWERALQWEAVWSDRRGEASRRAGGRIWYYNETLSFWERGQHCISVFERKQRNFQWAIEAWHISTQTAADRKRLRKVQRWKLSAEPRECECGFINKSDARLRVHQGSILTCFVCCIQLPFSPPWGRRLGTMVASHVSLLRNVRGCFTTATDHSGLMSRGYISQLLTERWPIS